MPLYEFCCPDCGEVFETIVFASDRQPVECPKCHGVKGKRLLSVFSSASPAAGGGSPSASSCGPARGGFS